MSKLSIRATYDFQDRPSPPRLRKCKDGTFECILHPHARMRPFRFHWYCPQCWELERYRYGRKFYFHLEPRQPAEKRTFAMHRTRAARVQPDFSDP